MKNITDYLQPEYTTVSRRLAFNEVDLPTTKASQLADAVSVTLGHGNPRCR